MVEPTISPPSQDPLSNYLAQQQAPLMTGQEWSALQTLDQLRPTFDRFLQGLDDAQKLEYVSLQKTWINAHEALTKAIHHVSETFKQQALASLRTGLKTLTDQDIDPTVAKIHTRYLSSSERVRRAPSESEVIKVASVTLWDAACMNYDGLTGWSYPGRTGLADASYLDDNINASAADFIALVRTLDIGSRLKQALDDALHANDSLGRPIMALVQVEFEFALIEALRNRATSRVDQDKYNQVKRALTGEVRWNTVEEMLLFLPHGVDNISWLPQRIGLTGEYAGKPPGDSLSIPHLVFSVIGCKGAFSFFPNRPGGALRHYDTPREACEEFHVAFQASYRIGRVDWLYQVMLIRDCARLSAIAKVTPPPRDLNTAAKLLYRLVQAIPTVSTKEPIGYTRTVVQNVPVVSLNKFYLKRCRGNLQELANQTPGFMPTLIEFFQTLFNEILNVLLIPVPGALKGLGRVRAFAMFAALGQSLIAGVYQSLQSEPAELLQAFSDLADLLISGRLHTRLALTVQRRHQRLYQQLSQHRTPNYPSLQAPQLLDRMLGVLDIPTRDLEVVLAASGTTRHTLNQVWDGAPASASLVEAAQRLNADQLINWVAAEADPGRPSPVGSFEVIAPLLTQLEAWPADTALSIEDHQGRELRRYSKSGTLAPQTIVTVTALENHQLAYAAPRRFTAHLPQAIVALLPALYGGSEQALRQHLARRAKAVRIDLFEALTGFAHASRSAPRGADASVLKLLPDSLGNDQPVPAVMTQLLALHPQVSPARLIEVLREHPLSDHQQTQLLASQLQPEALYLALRGARRTARRERLVDGLFQPRRFDAQTQQWAQAFADGVLRAEVGRALVVRPSSEPLPSIPASAGRRPVVIIDQQQGQFSVFDTVQQRAGEVLTGADSFYEAVVSQLSDPELKRLGSTPQRAIAALRAQIAQALLKNRAPDGSFYPHRRDIVQYAHTADTSRIPTETDALGFYLHASDRYLFIEGDYFKVAQADAQQPWRIQHPTLSDAYAPALTHNGAGAWRHEWENPLTWDGQRPFYRLGHRVRALSPDAIEQLQHISGVTAGILRRVHIRLERPPLMLIDALERHALHQRIEAGIHAGREFFAQVLDEITPACADELTVREGGARDDQITVLEAKVQMDKPQMQRLFFKALSEPAEPSADPLARTLQQQFPTLTARLAEDCVRFASTIERQSLSVGRVPFRIAQLASIWARYLRVSRALEGIYHSSVANEDSARLKQHGLPPAERLALGFTAATDEETLGKATASYLARNPELVDRLLGIRQAASFNPPRRIADGRIGYPLSGGDEWGPTDREQIARMRQLYPSKTDRQVFEVLENLGDSVRDREAALSRLFRERDTLNRTLEQWCMAAPAAHLPAQREAAERIRRCWRREDSTRGIEYELNLDDLALNSLPELGAWFGHVKVLSLKNNQLMALPRNFLRCFTQLHWLFLNGNQLDNLPAGLARLPYLSLLNLANNRLRFRLGDVVLLSELTRLVKLDLSTNPLRQGQRLNLYPLKQLRVLNLRNTQLESLPRGAVTLSSLDVFDLRDNRISVLTSHDLFLYPNVSRAMNLRGNPLSPASLQMLRRYREQPGQADIHFGLKPQGPPERAQPDRWLAVLPVSEVPRHQAQWEQLQQHPMAEHFFELLARLGGYPPFITAGYRALREDLTQRVWTLIERATHSEAMSVILFQHRFELHRGVDGWLLTLNGLELKYLALDLLARESEAAPLLSYFRALGRFNAIHDIVLRADPEQHWGLASCRMLAYRIALSQALDLPLGFTERLDRMLGAPSAESVARMRTLVVAAETQRDWPAQLAQEEHWVTFLMRKYPVRFEAQLGRYDRELEEASERVASGAMDEGTYLTTVARAQTLRQADENRLIAQLTQDAWTVFVTG